MNSKRINYIVVILNIISVIAMYILFVSVENLMLNMISGSNMYTSIWESKIIDILLNKVNIILLVLNLVIGIINIICAIQNRKNKKLSFWLFVFGFSYLYAAFSLFLINEEILRYASIALFGIAPIIFVIINFLNNLKNNKIKIIHVISYIGIVILAVLGLFDIIGWHWEKIAVIMQLIYVFYQEKNIEENISKKFFNIVIYCIIQMFITIGFMVIVLSAVLINKINSDRFDNLMMDVYNKIDSLQGATKSEIYVPVIEDSKYGFINEKGKEKISCEYDIVSFFNEIKIHNNTYYCAIAKKNGKFYIISKANDSIEINEEIGKKLEKIYYYSESDDIKKINDENKCMINYVNSFNFLLQVMFSKENIEINPQYLISRVNYNDENNLYNRMNISQDFLKYYEVMGVRNDKIILSFNTDEYEIEENVSQFTILDKSGNLLLETSALDIYENMYLIKNSKNKMVLVDENLNEISNQYDRISTNPSIDISQEYSSY